MWHIKYLLLSFSVYFCFVWIGTRLWGLLTRNRGGGRRYPIKILLLASFSASLFSVLVQYPTITFFGSFAVLSAVIVYFSKGTILSDLFVVVFTKCTHFVCMVTLLTFVIKI